MNGKDKQTAFIWNRNLFCNNLKVFNVPFDQVNVSLLNKSKELNVLQLKKTHAKKKKNTRKLRKHLHQFDVSSAHVNTHQIQKHAANMHNTTKYLYKNALQKQKCAENSHNTTKYRNALQVPQTTMEPL